MSKINTNMAGVTTLYHLRNKEDAMNQALERISSGLRINNAVDDAAGASLVNRMTSQVKGLEAAIRNAADAVSLTQTAEGALDEVSSILHRMRELSVQAANGVYTGQDRQALQNEVGQLQLELSRIAENSTFNAVKMLNGDFTNTAFQIGFLLFLPFLVIDMVIASILMSLGMMMLSPMLVAMPFKLLLFVLVDGWTMTVGSLVATYVV